MAEDRKLPYALISEYQRCYKKKYGNVPRVNVYRERWGMEDMIQSVGFDRAKELISYYFECERPGHPLQWLFYNFDKLDDMKMAVDDDRLARERTIQHTKERMAAQNES